MQHRSSEPLAAAAKPQEAVETPSSSAAPSSVAAPSATVAALSATPPQGQAPAVGVAWPAPAPPASGSPAAPAPPPTAAPAPKSATASPAPRSVPVAVPKPGATAPAGPAAPPAPPAPTPARPTVRSASFKRRHGLVLISFLLVVLLPGGVAAWYLWARAADQYASTVGFSVRTEETGAAISGILGGLTGFSGSSSKDTDILYEFLQSQKLVADMDARLDLKTMWSIPKNDPVFAYDPGPSGGSIEDLLAYWKRMVRVHYDSSAGLIEVRALAFTAADANAISKALFEASSQMINDLSAIAREDAIRYSREELAEALDRLKEARQVLTEFRIRNQMVDPSVDIQTQAGLLGMLQNQLAEALIDVDMLRDTTRPDDPRMTQAQRRVDVIQQRIAAERSKMGIGAANGTEALASLVGEYERLSVDREFAEKTYITALATYDSSLAEARRKSRYLAAYAEPTEAQTARYPRRLELLGVLSLFLFLFWAISVLVGYSLRDRR